MEVDGLRRPIDEREQRLEHRPELVGVARHRLPDEGAQRRPTDRATEHRIRVDRLAGADLEDRLAGGARHRVEVAVNAARGESRAHDPAAPHMIRSVGDETKVGPSTGMSTFIAS